MRRLRHFSESLFLLVFFMMGFIFIGNTVASAQSVVAEAVPSDATPAIDDVITVAVNVNMTGYPGQKLGSYTATLNWNPSVLQYVSYTGGSAPFTSPTVNTGSVGIGKLTFNDADPTGASGNVNTINVQLRAIASGTSALDLNYTAMSAAGTFINLMPYLTINDGSVTVPTPNTAPYATNVSISGTSQVGQTLTGNYTYNDADSDPEGTSTFRWLRNDSPIGGATSKTYQLVAADAGTMIKFEVTPVAVSGVSPGSPVQSAAVGPVTYPAPVADFSGTPTSGLKPLNVTFTDASTGEISSWSWTFGDGGTSTQQNPSHTYANAGTYTVALTVTGPGGSDTETKTNYITVTTPPPVADFTGTPTSGLKPLNVTFTDASTGEITSWSWTFGDGGTSTAQNPSHTYTTAGTYTVALTVTGPGGSDTETKVDYITVQEPAPVADFSGTPTSGDKPLDVDFTDLSTGAVTSWSWTFGDGGSSTQQNPSHTYANAGTHTVVLTVTGPGGSDTETKVNYITVTTPPPVANFSGTPTSGNKPLDVDFTDLSTGEVTSWSWTFGDGGTSTAQNPSHTYTTEGTYTVALTVTGPGGSDTETKTNYINVTVNAPVADFSGTPTSGLKPLNVTFTDASSGEITSWSWNFGDGGTSTQQNPSHTYANAGTYTVALTVTGPGGSDTETKTDYITVTTPPPVADFSGTPTSGLKPLNVTFTDASTGEITSWSWTFGDGGTSTQQNPSHTYTNAGTYTVSLTVTGPGGSDTETKTDYITVTTPPPVADFSGTPTFGFKPLNVTFTDASTGDITSWSWTFGDGGTSTQQNPSHTYTNAGTYTVVLTVTGPGGSDTETKVNYITVTTPPPVANFSGTPTSGNKPLDVDFTDLSTGEITSWSWTFGDGGTSTAQNPSHTYTTEGTYTVALTVTGPGGSDTETKTNYINVTVNAPVADFSGTPISGLKPLNVTFTDASTGEISSWSWTFGDGGSSTQQNPSHTYTNAGTYTVVLTVTGPGGSDTETKVDYITVQEPAPVADFSGTPTSGDKPLDVDFTDLSTGAVTSWSWTFGDGGTSAQQNPSHAYANAGTYTVSLTVTGPGGSDTETKQDYITVTEPAPVANFSGDPLTGNKPLNVQFTDLSTGTVTSWSWTFGDGGSSAQQNPSHTYTTEGNYTVTLTVAGPGGEDSETKENYITVTVSAPVAAFSGDPLSGQKPLNVQFTDASTGEITSRAWTFGDGGTSTAQNPSHTYTAAGTYTVALTVTGPGGSDTETKANYITVTEPDIAVSPTSYDFGDVQVTKSKQTTITVSNEGDAVLSVSAFSITGTHADQFSIISGGDPVAIDPDGSHEVVIQFAPTSEGAKTAALNITSNDDDESPLNVTLNGNGTPEPTPNIAVAPQQVDFGGVVIGSSKVENVTVSNSGDAPLDVTATSIDQEQIELPLLATAQTTDEFTIVSGGAPFQVAPGQSHIIKIKFAPLSEGEKQAALNIESNDPESQVEHINLTGVGIYEPPVGRFFATPTFGYPALSVKFEDESEGAPTAWRWEFGDGVTSTEQNPTHIYRRPGLYDVKLTITTALGDVVVEKDDFIDVWGYEPIHHAPLTLIDNNYALLKESWEHAIDEDVSGWIGTTTARDNPPWAIFGFKDGLMKKIHKVALLADTDVGYRERWVKDFSVYVSTSGIKDGDFVKVLDGTKKSGGWDTFEFDPVNAKYIKLVLGQSAIGWRQVGEFRVCPVRGVASEKLSSVTVTSPHIGDGVDRSAMTIKVADHNGQPITGLTQHDFYIYVHAGKPILSPIIETSTPGEYKTTIANLGGVNMPIEVMVNGVIVGHPFITFTEPKVTIASLVLLKGSETVEGEGWDNAIDGDKDDWDGTVTASGVAPFAIFGFADNGIKAVYKLNLLVDTNVGYANRWIRRFRLQVSTTGMYDTDFTTVYDGIQNQGKWETHIFPAANAKYVKFIVDYPTTGMKQLGELELEIGQALALTDPLSGIESILGTPVEFSLKDNYPNPFNPETRIEFALPRAQQVTMMVFNQIGQLVRTLYDARLDAGYHAITWNSQNDAGIQLPSGTYFLLFQAEDCRETRKMLLIR